MAIKWNRESFIVSLLTVLILVAVGYYGYHVLVAPSQASAESSTRIVEDQTRLLEQYPAEEAVLADYQEAYDETTRFLPDVEAVNEALVILKATADRYELELMHTNRVSDREPIENVVDDFVKTTYQVEVTGSSPEAIRQFIESLETEDRMWAVTNATIQKSGEKSYTGSLMTDLMYRLSE